ncbi:MAG: hypothetical protein IJ355_08840 [Prevotella sp.]|nr:hypothetical protein [Prevotella sp.]
MKTFKYFSMMLAMLVCSIGFVSCSSDDDDDTNASTSNSIYGTWVEEGDDYVLEFTLNNNGSGNYRLTEGKRSETGPFEFGYDNEEKVLTIVPDGADTFILAGEWNVTVTPTILRIQGVSDIDGRSYTFQFRRK